MSVTAAVLVAALVVMGAGFPAKRVPPARFATGVCTAIGGWMKSLEDGAAGVRTSLSGTNPKLRDVRAALVDYLGSTVHATGKAIDRIEAAGTPTTPKGVKAAAGLVAGFKEIRASLRKLQLRAGHISTARRAVALSEIKDLDRRVSVEFNSFQATFKKLDKLDPDHQLQRSFNAAAACQALAS
jgi:hypothetical protein